MRGTSWKAVAVVSGLLCAPVLAEEAVPHLPYGVPVPQGQALSAAPEPFDEAVHGRAHPNTQPQVNEVLKGAAARLPERSSRPRPRDPIPDIFPGSGDRGFWVNQGQGIFAANDAQTDLVIPDNAIGTTLYAPTHMPAGNGCVETVTAHWRYSGMATTAHAHGFWDHCGIDGATGWQTFEFMDAAWKDKYVRLFDGEDRYFTEAYKDGSGCSHGVLYNFNLGLWEEKLTPICGSSGFTNGWTMWESHYLMDVALRCPAFPRIRASNLQIYTVSAWPALSPSNSTQLGPYGLCWTNGTYNFQVSVPNSDWTALTP